MSTAREEILERIRTALADVPSAERAADVTVAREYRRPACHRPGARRAWR